MQPAQRFSIGELAQLAGVSRRAVRFYVQRKLIPPPLGAGRGHYYTEEHLQRLLSIKLLQDRGLTLEGIEQHLSDKPYFHADLRACAPRDAARAPTGNLARDHEDRDSPPDLSLWTRVGVAEGIELHVEGGRYRLSPARLQRLRQAVQAIVGDPFLSDCDTDKGDGDDDKG